MPIYEFICEDCGKEFEVLLKSRDEIESVRCENCNSPRIKRLMSVTGAVITGSSSSSKPTVSTQKCESGTCAHLNLPGYSR
ncbi:FmdB family zinc ribbon protein [Thermodesulfatator autotrophicus]|uniref:FmdB family transcriptional regulator n=1 Tax=Thermodesulfatator autotrophicus TaxID=1795632 RepID=A0A177E9N5_9BACT|nr:zinc ribbon domain-containing protein [Thermodesulfatator autotrophicus]OAG28231.1 FmdB family transcriptional regulator [Thermodesulfatator autotrophicus]